MFQRHGQRAVWLKLLTVATPARHNVGASSAAHAVHLCEYKTRGWAGSGRGCSGCGSGWWVDSSLWFALLASLRCIVCLPGLLLCACFRLSLPLLGSFIIWLKAPCFGSLFVPAGGSALPLGLGDLNNLFLLVGLGLFILSQNTLSNPFAGYQP